MPVILPFRATRSRVPQIYIPGEEEPLPLADLFEDPEPALFLYRQTFRFPGDPEEHIRDGVIGLLNRNEATIYPHEETFPDRVLSCAEAIRRAQTDPGSLWLWCNHVTLPVATSPPSLEALDRFGCRHQFWPITHGDRIRELQSALADAPLFLADGHHRFAAGWNFATIQVRSSALRTRSGPASLDLIEHNARRGILLPPKSTDFYPKLAAGLIMYRHQNESVTPATPQRLGVRNPSS